MDKYTVHGAMLPVDIAIVMDHREKIGRKLDEQEIGHVLREISYRFLRGYTGDFPYLLNMKQRLDQYGRLFASQSAGTLNCLYAMATQEIQQSIRQHTKEQKASGKTKRLSVQLGARPVVGELFSAEDMPNVGLGEMVNGKPRHPSTYFQRTDHNPQD